MYIPKDAILMLSGVSCVGKTTTAYEIVKNYSEFRRVSEYDLLRTVVRTAYEYVAEEAHINKDELISKYNALFESITSSNFEITKLQSEQLLPYVKEIILRQQRRRIPTIIEGTGIIPSTYFPNNQPLTWLTKHVVFINLYISNEEEHISRRRSRSKERDYYEAVNKTEMIISQSRADKNQLLHMQALELHQIFNNVFSIDVSSCTPSHTASKIMELVSDYFNNYC
ncbi:MAG: hypothetical protein K2G55_02990 [Lachnospiraceae bacterium]|nr:hypothetical protein [Lachnospiraceae bacterium]